MTINNIINTVKSAAQVAILPDVRTIKTLEELGRVLQSAPLHVVETMRPLILNRFVALKVVMNPNKGMELINKYLSNRMFTPVDRKDMSVMVDSLKALYPADPKAAALVKFMLRPELDALKALRAVVKLIERPVTPKLLTVAQTDWVTRVDSAFFKKKFW